MIKKLLYLFICVLLAGSLLPVLSACNKQEDPDYLIAYTNSTNDDVEYLAYEMPLKDSMSDDEIANDLISHLFSEVPEDGVHYKPLPQGVLLNSYQIRNGVLTLDFDEGYATLTNVQEIILKACVCLTMAQVESIQSIQFTMNGEPVKDSEGNDVGSMDLDQFVNLLLSDEDLLKQETSLNIYFTNSDGSRLVAYKYQFTLDNQAQSLEEYIVRKLIEGPDKGNGYPTLDPDVELLNIMTTDNTCYVNFSSSFLEQNQIVSDDIMIYSIVNSLTELAYINDVQFLVNGESKIQLHKSMDLSKPLSTRIDLIEGN